MSRFATLVLASLSTLSLAGCPELGPATLVPPTQPGNVTIQSGFYSLSLHESWFVGCDRASQQDLREFQSASGVQVPLFLQVRGEDVKASVEGLRMYGERQGNRFHIESEGDIAVSSPSEPPQEDTAVVYPDDPDSEPSNPGNGSTEPGDDGSTRPDDADPRPSDCDTGVVWEDSDEAPDTGWTEPDDRPCGDRDPDDRPCDQDTTRPDCGHGHGHRPPPAEPMISFDGSALSTNVLGGTVTIDLSPWYGRCEVKFAARIVDEDAVSSESRPNRGQGGRPVTSTEVD